MTSQFGEVLFYNGEQHELLTTPLEPYLETHGGRPSPNMICSGLHRGYIGTWEIVGGRLYLNEVSCLGEGDHNHLQSIFPNANGPVFASWFSGSLRVPCGNLEERVHYGFQRRYENNLILNVQHGCVIFEGPEKKIDQEGDDPP